ncbi:lysine--tRNA ligase [Patescibacteria group bacterium]|nr:lysine--tRNA ligase [Patescibacteria group bacterium]
MGIISDREQKLKNIIKNGVDPYPARAQRDYLCQKATLDFDQIEKKEKEITLAGRLVLLRLHGKVCFANLEDGSGRFQLFLAQDDLGEEAYNFFKENIDLGDFLQVQGKVFLTKKGEKTLRLNSYRLLSKSLLPLPEKWHGLSDPEKRFRQRYLDLIANPEVRKIFTTRSKTIKLIREFLNQRNFMEVETPILQSLAGGATAKPFVTHHQALDRDLYLRVAPELYLKRLIIGNLERVYEVARCFRNEGIDRTHSPEFTQVEFYQAYADYQDLMQLTEELMVFLLKGLGLGMKIEFQGQKIDFTPPYPRWDFREALIEKAGIDIDQYPEREQLAAEAKKKGLALDKTWGRGRILDEIYKKFVLSQAKQPIFIINHPLELSPLAKKIKERPAYVERFQLLVNGLETCNAFSELNDPLDQAARFKEQKKLQDKGDEEAQAADEEFVTALKYGMPPTAGEGIGIDRLVNILTNTQNIREVILFPTLKAQPPRDKK